MGRHRKTKTSTGRTVLDTIRAATTPPAPAPEPTPPPARPTPTPHPRPGTPAPEPDGTRPDLRAVDADGRPSTVTVDSADNVAVLYPDGSRVPVGWELDAVTDGGKHHRYVADVPHTARLAAGMVIQAGTWVMPVKLDPDTAAWYANGAR